MKKLTLLLTFVLLSVVSALKANAQAAGPDWLGIWCTIDVNLASDPRDGRYATYSFPHPPECLGPMQYSFGYPMYYDNTYFPCVGYGAPYIIVDAGEPFLRLDLVQLGRDVELMMEGQSMIPDQIEAIIDFPVQKLIDGYQCYYSIRLAINKNPIDY